MNNPLSHSTCDDFIHGWYAILASSELRKRPSIACQRFGVQLLVWRTSDGVRVFRDRCPHRGVRLNSASATENCITCPFHGLQFNSDGDCIKIPVQQDAAAIPKAMHLQSFTTREAHGFIFIWWGTQPEQLPSIDWFDDELVSCESSPEHWADCDVGLSRNIENQLDAAHLPFVHARSIGRLLKSPQMVLECEVQNQRIHMHQAGKTNTWVEMQLPNLWLNCIGRQSFVFLAFAPITRTRTRIYTRYYQGFLKFPVVKALFGWLMGWSNLWILREDIRIIETHDSPISPPLDGSELLLACDIAVIEYRRLRAKLSASGSSDQSANPSG